MPRVTIKEMSGEPGNAAVELSVSIGTLVLDIRFTDRSATPSAAFPQLVVNERPASGGTRRLVTERVRG